MKYFKWLPGRQQGCEYKKMCLYSFRIFGWGMDAYILKYPPHTLLNWHTDPVKGGEHYRVNYTLKGLSRFCIKYGGETHCTNDAKPGMFRPDLHEHRVKTYALETIKLSFGFVKFTK